MDEKALAAVEHVRRLDPDAEPMISDFLEWADTVPAADRAAYIIALRVVDFARTREQIEACGWRGDDERAWSDYFRAYDVGIMHVSEILRRGDGGMRWSRSSISAEVAALVDEVRG